MVWHALSQFITIECVQSALFHTIPYTPRISPGDVITEGNDHFSNQATFRLIFNIAFFFFAFFLLAALKAPNVDHKRILLTKV